MVADKKSIVIDMDSQTHYGTLTVWETGEAELDCLEVRTEHRHTEHRDLKTFQDLFQAVLDLENIVYGR